MDYTNFKRNRFKNDLIYHDFYPSICAFMVKKMVTNIFIFSFQPQIKWILQAKIWKIQKVLHHHQLNSNKRYSQKKFLENLSGFFWKIYSRFLFTCSFPYLLYPNFNIFIKIFGEILLFWSFWIQLQTKSQKIINFLKEIPKIFLNFIIIFQKFNQIF